ncbi:hypothetical protein [Pseudomonas asplenii]|uniref:hypothetical protein n=1 Tax=Pseudomonas asplenii TaxID=53407 RepID=UPI00039E43BE|nr:hypothetical protein [Pseudomonas fuscovaginae]
MRKSDFSADELDTYVNIMAVIGDMSPGRVRAMYMVSSGIVRELIAMAIKDSISAGNRELKLEFPLVD